MRSLQRTKTSSCWTRDGRHHASMDTRFRLLGRRRREEIRQLARDAYMTSPSFAKQEAERAVRHRYSGILSMLIVGLAVKLAIELIAYWVKQKFTHPPMTFEAGEPGADQ